MPATARSLLPQCAVCLLLAANASGSAEPAAPVGGKRAPQEASAQGTVEALLWLTPMVSVDAMRQAFFRDAGARYGDILWWSASDWNNQMPLASPAERQIYFNFNTQQGPVVVDLQAALGAPLTGALYDAWQQPLVTVDNDRTQARKFLLLPPGYKHSVPAGFVPVQSQTYNGYGLLQAPPKASSDAVSSLTLAKMLKLYPLAQAANPPPPRVIDMAVRLFDANVRFDASFLANLTRMVNEEPVQTHDPALITLLKTLGIEKGKQVRASAKAQASLKPALAQADAQLQQAFAGDLQVFWSGSRWALPAVVAAGSPMAGDSSDLPDVKARKVSAVLGDRSAARPGDAGLALLSLRDVHDQALTGGTTYRLRIPANVPVQRFWVLSVYDRATRTYIRKSPRVALASNGALQSNADGSIDIYFGPKAPTDQEANWIYTGADREWFAIFRFYGPEKPLFEKTWRLPDIERVDAAAR
jgi:hypothetical protein